MGELTTADILRAIADNMDAKETTDDKAAGPPYLFGYLPDNLPDPKPTIVWMMEFDGDQVVFRRYQKGFEIPDEIHRPASLREAVVWAAAIIQGFQPPHSLRECDIRGA